MTFTELQDEELEKIVNEDSPVVLHCEVSGWPVPLVIWLKDGVLVKETDKVIITTNKSSSMYLTSSFLTLVSPSKEDSGFYWCNASNVYYNVEMKKMYQLDVIILQPPSKWIDYVTCVAAMTISLPH